MKSFSRVRLLATPWTSAYQAPPSMGFSRQHASEVMLKIIQPRLQQYVNCNLPGVQARFRKGSGSRDQIANIRWIIKKARKFQKNISVQFSSVAQSCLSVINEAEVDVFLELSCFFDDPTNVGNFISGSSSVFSKSNLNIWKFSVHIRLKHSLENFEHYFTSM